MIRGGAAVIAAGANSKYNRARMADAPRVSNLPTSVAIVATGIIGRSWLRVFSRAGVPVRAWDPDASSLAQAIDWHAQTVTLEEADAQHAAAQIALVAQARSINEALDGADYVQESGPESLEAKRAIYVQLAKRAERTTILASSTSTLDMTEIAHGIDSADRCIVAHPVNPPHVIPVVEVLGGRYTSAEVVERTERWLRGVRQAPVRLKFYVPGFLLNRLQAALVREAVDLVSRRVASVDDVDAVIRNGLGLRWAFLGPFGTADTNADGGAREYFSRYGAAFESLWRDLRTDVRFDAELLQRIELETQPLWRGRPATERRAWRDRAVAALRALKTQLAEP